MIDPPKATKAPDIQRKAIMDWSAGTVTSYDARRLVDNAMQSSINIGLEQNGVVRPRPSMALYGPQIDGGTFLGELFECKVMVNASPVFYLMAMVVVDGVANVYYTTGESNSWSKVTGKDYDTSAPAHFIVAQGKILVMNGVDNLSIIDPLTWTISTFNEIQTPTAPTVTVSASLQDQNPGYIIYYAITANSSIGETAGSVVTSKSIKKPRDFWKTDTNDSCTVEWTPVQGATSYNVYVGSSTDGSGSPTLYLVQANIDPSVTSFVDDGNKATNIARPLPSYNSTAGPKAKRGTVINGRIWLVGDSDNPYYVWYGGDPGHELDFSPTGYGGGYVSIADGTSEIPISVMPFRKGQGDPTVVVLTQGSNGSGKRYHITYSVVDYGGEPMAVWSPAEDSGTDGTDSPDGVVIYNNSLYYPSRDGFKTTGTQPSLQNVLSTKRISNTIQDQISLLNSETMPKAVGLAYEGCIYWALPVGSQKNNRIFVFDIDHKGAWICSWYVNADWIMLYNDNSGATHFLILSNNKIYELSRKKLTLDATGAFKTELASGKIAWSKDVREWARLIQVVFTVIKPLGDIDFEITAMTEDGKMTFYNQLSVSSTTSGHGWSEPTVGWSSLRGWSEVSYQETENLTEDEDIIIEVDEDVQYFEYKVSSTKAGTDYKLSSVVAEFVPIGIKDLS